MKVLKVTGCVEVTGAVNAVEGSITNFNEVDEAIGKAENEDR